MAAQKKELIYRGVLNTVGAVSSTVDIPVPTDSVMGFKGIIVLHDTSSGSEDGGYGENKGYIFNNSGTCTINTSSPFFIQEAALAACTIAYTVNTTNLRLTVTGAAGITIDWQYRILVVIN